MRELSFPHQYFDLCLPNEHEEQGKFYLLCLLILFTVCVSVFIKTAIDNGPDPQIPKMTFSEGQSNKLTATYAFSQTPSVDLL